MSNTNVPVGVSSVAGYTVTVGTFAAAVVAYLSGDHSQNTIVILALGAFSAVSFVVTQAGRYAQAHAHAKKALLVQPFTSGTASAVTVTTSGPNPPVEPTAAVKPAPRKRTPKPKAAS